MRLRLPMARRTPLEGRVDCRIWDSMLELLGDIHGCIIRGTK